MLDQLKLKISKLCTNEKFNIRSNLSITGNMDVTKNLLILSEIDFVNSGIIAKGNGIQKFLNVGGNLNVGYNALYVN